MGLGGTFLGPVARRCDEFGMRWDSVNAVGTCCEVVRRAWHVVGRIWDTLRGGATRLGYGGTLLGRVVKRCDEFGTWWDTAGCFWVELRGGATSLGHGGMR